MRFVGRGKFIGKDKYEQGNVCLAYMSGKSKR